MKTYQLYINGEYVDSKSGKTLDVIDPATTEVIARTPDAIHRTRPQAMKTAADARVRRVLAVMESARSNTVSTR